MNKKFFLASKTNIFGLLLAFIGFLQGPEFLEAAGLTGEGIRLVSVILGAVVMILRGVTNQGVTLDPRAGRGK